MMSEKAHSQGTPSRWDKNYASWNRRRDVDEKKRSQRFEEKNLR